MSIKALEHNRGSDLRPAPSGARSPCRFPARWWRSFFFNDPPDHLTRRSRVAEVAGLPTSEVWRLPLRWVNRRVVVLSVLLMALGISLVGCSRGPELSPAAYDLAKAIDNLCNLRDAGKLPQAREILGAKLAAGEINQVEHDALARGIEIAATGDWEQAGAATRQLLLDQNE